VKYDPEQYHRRSIRLKGYDYSHTGAYFVTICTQNREYLFGDMLDGKMALNDAGQMIEKWWNKLSQKYGDVWIDTYVVMPNHFHGIITITTNTVGANPCIRPNETNPCIRPNTGDHLTRGENMVSPLQGLGIYISWFKRMSTNEYIRGVKQHGWLPFPGKLWQRNYYDHIIRNESELERIREYIVNNPLKWESDRENPNIRVRRAMPQQDEPWRI
jgi:REP element-mobilizing transposase RayT